MPHAELRCLGSEQSNIAMGGKRYHAQGLGVFARNLKGLTTDGAG
jgi:hypothetical protein